VRREPMRDRTGAVCAALERVRRHAAVGPGGVWAERAAATVRRSRIPGVSRGVSGEHGGDLRRKVSGTSALVSGRGLGFGLG
jgi:hypothetical protein